MFDTDKFIACIQEKPELWDKNKKEYSDENAREKAWMEVGEAFYREWADLNANEREERGKKMKIKWRNIRDNFLNSLNRGRRGDPASKIIKYEFADSLQFLLNAMVKRETSSDIQDTENAGFKAPSEDISQRPSTSSDSGLPEPPRSFSRRVPEDPRLSSRKVPEELTPFQSALLQKLNRSTTTDHRDEDSDKMFLLSLLSDYKLLNESEKMDFKFLTWQFLRNAQQNRAIIARRTAFIEKYETPERTSPYSTPEPESVNFDRQSTSTLMRRPYSTPFTSLKFSRSSSPIQPSLPSPPLCSIRRWRPPRTPSPTTLLSEPRADLHSSTFHLPH